MTESRKEQMREYLRNRRASRKANGLCTECGKPADNGHSRCADCRAKNFYYQKRHIFKQTGLFGGVTHG